MRQVELMKGLNLNAIKLSADTVQMALIVSTADLKAAIKALT